MPPALPLKQWPEPRYTANAQLLHGYIGGLIDRDAKQRDGSYSVDQLHGELIVKHRTGNRYRITVEQISGEE